MDKFEGLEQGERVDKIGFGDLQLIQKPEEFCYGVDAVILAHFAATHTSRQPDSIVDLGTGTGIIPLILSHKTRASMITGVEIQKDSYARCVKNSALNHLESRVSFINADVKDCEQWARNMTGKIDVVVSNPPYTAGSTGLTNDNPAKTIARHETTAGLYDFMKCAALLLRQKGDFFMVHRPSRLVDICCFGRENGLEVKELRFVSPTINAKANILLVHLVKGGGRELKMLEPLFVYDTEGQYTEEVRDNYR